MARNPGWRRWWGRVGLVVLGTGIVTTAWVVVRGDVSPNGVPPGSPEPIAGGYFEASGVVHVPGTRQFLFIDDDRNRELLLLELGADGRQRGVAVSIPLAADVTDLEGITRDGQHYYVAGSQSKPTGIEGDGLVRFSYDPSARRVAQVERIRDFKAWLARHVPELRGVDRLMGDHVLNIEGLAWDSSGQRLLLGLRAPLVEGDALIIPVALSNPDSGFTTENLAIAGETIRLPLHGAGVRSIEFDAVSGNFLVIAGAVLNSESLDFRVYEWNGDAGWAPRGVATYSRSLKPEGITRAVMDGRTVRVLVFDTSRFAILGHAAALPTRLHGSIIPTLLGGY